MRLALLLATTTLLAACGGGGGGDGPQSAGNVAPGGGGTAPGGSNPHSFVEPTLVKTYAGVGAGQHFEYQVAQGPGSPDINRVSGELYNSNANTLRGTEIGVKFDPRSAEFEISYNDPLASIAHSGTYQDPAHRTAFGGASEPQYSVPDIAGEGMLYLESGAATNGFITGNRLGFVLAAGEDSGSGTKQTFFYQKPGTETRYVTYAGWVRNNYAATRDPDTGVVTTNLTLDRAAFAWGELTPADRIPASGTGTFTGSMLATMVFNDQLDVDPGNSSHFQWIHGDATTMVDFGKATFDLTLTGTTTDPQTDGVAAIHSILGGASFFAHGDGTINIAGTGGFTGQFDEVYFDQAGGRVVIDTSYLSGSSIDGAFFGPNAEEVGGGFRAVGGVPDQRVDIMGAFTGER